MTIIPSYPDPTIAAMKNHCVQASSKEPRRGYLGASFIGHDCDRALWYEANECASDAFPIEALWRFEDGHRTEELVASRLRLIDGITLHTHNEHGEQYGFSMFDGRFQGHIDGIIVGLLQSPRLPHIWENKCVGEDVFKKFVALREKRIVDDDLLLEWNSSYYAQAQIYMHTFKLVRHYMTVASAGGRDISSCRTKYNREHALQIIERVERILSTRTEPPQCSSKPDFYKCRMCKFNTICHK